MTEDNIITLRVDTTQDIPVERVLTAALEGELESAVVIGTDKDGYFYFASSQAHRGEVLWLMELAKKELLDV